MQELDEFSFIQMYNGVCFIFLENNLLFLLCKKGDVFFPQMSDDLPKIDRCDFQGCPVGLFKFFIFHNGTSNLYQAIDFLVKERIIFRRAFYNPIIHSFQIALNGRDGSFDLVAQIREKIGADFLLMGEIFIQCINRTDKCSELVLFSVFDLPIFLPGNDVGKIFHDGLDGTKRETYPKSGDDQNKEDNNHIYEKHCSKSFEDELPFRRGIMEKRKIENPGKKGINSLYKKHLFYGVLGDPDLLKRIYDPWGIYIRIGGKILQRDGDSREIREDFLVLFYRRIIEIFCLREGGEEIEIDIGYFLFYTRQVLRKILRRKILKRENIYPDRRKKDEEYIDEEFR